MEKKAKVERGDPTSATSKPKATSQDLIVETTDAILSRCVGMKPTTVASAHGRWISSDSHLDRPSDSAHGEALGDGPRRRSSSPPDGAGRPPVGALRIAAPLHHRGFTSSLAAVSPPTTSSLQCPLCLGRWVAVPPQAQKVWHLVSYYYSHRNHDLT
ncbi:hypothetical protein ZWY2020_026294 [Hordeum vulgare]|nr:hypothetical protein ZWY2020_026294 [Hordeum vulgare]